MEYKDKPETATTYGVKFLQGQGFFKSKWAFGGGDTCHACGRDHLLFARKGQWRELPVPMLYEVGTGEKDVSVKAGAWVRLVERGSPLERAVVEVVG